MEHGGQGVGNEDDVWIQENEVRSMGEVWDLEDGVGDIED